MRILDIIHMIQGTFDSMVDYAASHSLPIPESLGKVDDRLIMRMEDDKGNRFKATIYISLEVE